MKIALKAQSRQAANVPDCGKAIDHVELLLQRKLRDVPVLSFLCFTFLETASMIITSSDYNYANAIFYI